MAMLVMQRFPCAVVGAWLCLFASSYLSAAETKSDAEWTGTVAAAKKEGRVGVFLYQRENIEAAVKAFEKKFPEIQVITASTPAAETGTASDGGTPRRKISLGYLYLRANDAVSGLYIPAKALDPIKPALLLPEVTDRSKWWEGKHQYMDPDGESHLRFPRQRRYAESFFTTRIWLTRMNSNPTGMSSKQSGAAKSSPSTRASPAGRASARAISLQYSRLRRQIFNAAVR